MFAFIQSGRERHVIILVLAGKTRNYLVPAGKTNNYLCANFINVNKAMPLTMELHLLLSKRTQNR